MNLVLYYYFYKTIDEKIENIINKYLYKKDEEKTYIEMQKEIEEFIFNIYNKYNYSIKVNLGIYNYYHELNIVYYLISDYPEVNLSIL